MLQGKIKQSEGTKQASKPDSDMAEVLELSYLSLTMITMLRTLMEKMGRM